MEWLGLSVLSGFWNTICSLRLSALGRFSIGMPPISSPSSITVPPVDFSMPVSTLAKVDLPQPDSPTMASVMPRLASMLMSFSALTS